MSKRALVLVEGQTEERFVKDVLAPAFWPRSLYLSPTILVTKRVKDGPNFKGGVTRFAQFENDLRRLMNAGGAVVTTMLDYYGLPDDFPGMNTRPNGTPPATRGACGAVDQRILRIARQLRSFSCAPRVRSMALRLTGRTARRHE
ncbi:MAG TPA: DUF4276 family protein [Thermoanaerobaculia bacterium]|nr:DUF4276 family protein [Thermoanaerobaculia bacterium]